MPKTYDHGYVRQHSLATAVTCSARTVATARLTTAAAGYTCFLIVVALTQHSPVSALAALSEHLPSIPHITRVLAGARDDTVARATPGLVFRSNGGNDETLLLAARRSGYRGCRGSGDLKKRLLRGPGNREVHRPRSAGRCFRNRCFLPHTLPSHPIIYNAAPRDVLLPFFPFLLCTRTLLAYAPMKNQSPTMSQIYNTLYPLVNGTVIQGTRDER